MTVLLYYLLIKTNLKTMRIIFFALLVYVTCKPFITLQESEFKMQV